MISGQNYFLTRSRGFVIRARKVYLKKFPHYRYVYSSDLVFKFETKRILKENLRFLYSFKLTSFFSPSLSMVTRFSTLALSI
jgi:hypothetical protein